jgi:hypothetical protein
VAILASAQWWVRADGDNTNGGGFDSAISGAGTNYCDQAAAQLTLTDLATSGAGSTTLTSATGGFTTAMIGNCIRISAGTNFQTGYYFVTARTDTNTVTLDRTPSSGGAGSGGSGKLGGAFASVGNFATGGTLGSAAANFGVATPLGPGHIVNVRGAGSDTPSSADYVHDGGYWQFPDGSSSGGGGLIQWIGYNGRPRFHYAGILFYSLTDHYFENFYVQMTAQLFSGHGFVFVAAGMVGVRNMVLDQNGIDAVQLTVVSARDVVIKNTGVTTAGGAAGINAASYSGNFTDIEIVGLRGRGMTCSAYPTINNVVIRNCGSHGIVLEATGGNGLIANIQNVTLKGNGGNGIYFNGVRPYANIQNCVLDSNGGYGISVSANYTGTSNHNLALFKPRNCAFRNNSSGKYQNWSGEGDIDLTADPFINAAGGDFRLNNVAGGGAALRSAAYPTAAFREMPSTVHYGDIGAVQSRGPRGEASVILGVM